MVSLLAEHYGNNILLEKNLLNTNSNIKKIMQLFLENKINQLEYIDTLKKNYFLNSKTGDLFYTFKNHKDFADILLKNGYKKTSPDYFLNEPFNYVYSSEEIDHYLKNEEHFIESISLNNNNGISGKYAFFLKNNYIIFYSIKENKTDYFFNCEKEYKIKDFKINKDLFVYMIIEHNDKCFLVKTHLGKCFLELNKENSPFLKENIIYSIELNDNYKELLHIEDDLYYLLTEDCKIVKIELEKKYFFEKDNKLFFTFCPSMEKYEKFIISKEQFDSLQMYNYLNIFGLNDFLIDGKFKITTEHINLFKTLFANAFSNTLNGGLNYFNAKSEGLKADLLHVKSKKDYQIFIDDEYFNISGNFVYGNYEKGNYKILITPKRVELLFQDSNKWVSKKQVYFSSYYDFYFCNLHFQFKKFSFPEKMKYEFSLSSFDEYTFKNELTQMMIKEIANDSKTIDTIIESSTIKDDEITYTNVEFDATKIIFYNFYDLKEKKFKYNNFTISVKANQKFSLENVKAFNFNKQHIIKNNSIYFREDGVLDYTTTDKLQYELINQKGYITNFWIENQGKKIFFKNINNSLTESNENDYDYSITIPYIKDYVWKSDRIYGDIFIDDNDDLSVEQKFSEELLLTNKFFAEPLFFKFILNVNKLDDFHLFDDNNNEVLNYIAEPYKDKFIIYFNKKRNRKYYYNLKDKKYIYFDAMKAYRNIETIHYFNENGVIKFNQTQNIKSFKISTTSLYNGIINVYLYNTAKGEVNRMQLDSSELNKKFEIGLHVNKIQLEITSKDIDSFSFIEETGDSFISNNTLTFFKQSRNEPIYISNIIEDIDINKVNFDNIKINTEYKYHDNKFTKSNDGNIFIKPPFRNSIPIESNINYEAYDCKLFISTMSHKDDFYENNFKSIGNFYRYNKEIAKEFVSSNNKIFNIKEVQDEE